MNAKTKSTTDAQPPNVTALAAIVTTVLDYRKEKPTLGGVARIAGRASALLRIPKDNRTSVENAATLEICRRYDLLPIRYRNAAQSPSFSWWARRCNSGC